MEEAVMLWLATCLTLAAVLGGCAFVGWRREVRRDAEREEFERRSIRPEPTRLLGND
jgi:hypothetical protein